jgi:hypothetical protein
MSCKPEDWYAVNLNLSVTTRCRKSLAKMHVLAALLIKPNLDQLRLS